MEAIIDSHCINVHIVMNVNVIVNVNVNMFDWTFAAVSINGAVSIHGVVSN